MEPGEDTRPPISSRPIEAIAQAYLVTTEGNEGQALRIAITDALAVSAEVQPPDETLDLGVRSANQCDSAKGSREHDEDSEISHPAMLSHGEPFSEVTQAPWGSMPHPVVRSSGECGVVITSRSPSSRDRSPEPRRRPAPQDADPASQTRCPAQPP